MDVWARRNSPFHQVFLHEEISVVAESVSSYMRENLGHRGNCAGEETRVSNMKQLEAI